MAGRDNSPPGAGPDSSLAYSVLENDKDTDVSFEPRGAAGGGGGSSRFDGRGSSRGPTASGSGTLTRGLRCCCPHFILITVYIAFLLAGGGLFVLLENQIRDAQDADLHLEAAEYEHLKEMVGGAVVELAMSSGDGNLTEDWNNFITLVQNPFYTRHIHRVFGSQDLSFTRSVMFCLTTVTTIGYGDSVPNTAGGKTLVFFLVLLGIPLTLIVLADVGKLLARGVASLVNMWRYRRGAKRTADSADDYGDDTAGDPETPAVIPVILFILYFILGACVISLIEGWSYGDGLYFTMVTLSTVGYGDITPINHFGNVPSFIVILLYNLLGFSILAMCFFLLRAKVYWLVSKVAEKVGF